MDPKLLITIMAFLGGNFALPTNTADLKPSVKIINGTIGQKVPYQVFLLIDGNMGIRWCSGTLLTPNYVLTTAFCLSGASEVSVRLGVFQRLNYTEIGQVNASASTWTTHEGFNSTTHSFDVGLIKLEKSVKISEYIQLAPLVNRTDAAQTFEDQVGTYTGWGIPAYYDAPSVDFLNVVNASIISSTACREYYDFIDKAQLCTSGEGGVSYCNGDQGGPLIVDGVQVGIISGGDSVCLWDGGDWPTIFTKIGSYLDWIVDNSDYVVH